MSHTYDYPRPALTTDLACFRWTDHLEILLIERGSYPFQGKWALPGGFVDEEEPIVEACRREMQEETGVTVDKIWPIGVFARPGRDPRARTVAVVYGAVLLPTPNRKQAMMQRKPAGTR